ncbi:hypothetical protein PSHT_04466, partial [Puccinia striiformis]
NMSNTTNNTTQSMINSYLNSASHNQGSPDTIHSSQDKETSLEDSSSSSSESESLPCDGLSLLSSPAPTAVVPFKCIVSYSLQLEDRKRGQKPTWKPAKSPATTKMYIDIDPNKQSFKEFEIAAADMCNTILCGISLMIGKGGKKNIPKIDWQVFIPNNKGGIHPKSRPLHLESEANYRGWVKLIAKKNLPREGGIFLSQVNPKQKKKTKVRLEAAAAKSGTSHQAGNHDNSEEDDSDNEGLTIEEIPKRYSTDNEGLTIEEIPKRYSIDSEKIRIWATALLERKKGVLIDSPPSELQYKVRQKASVAAEPAPPPKTIAMNAALTAFLQVAANNRAQLMANRTATHLAPFNPPGMNGNHTLEVYLTFIGRVPPEAGRVSRILRRKGFISYRSFASSNLNNEYLTAMELPLDLVICLRDSASDFFNHLKANVV